MQLPTAWTLISKTASVFTVHGYGNFRLEPSYCGPKQKCKYPNRKGKEGKKKTPHQLPLRSVFLRREHLLAYFCLKQHAASQHHLGHMFAVMMRLTRRLAVGLLTVWTVVDINIRSFVLIHSNTAANKGNLLLNLLGQKTDRYLAIMQF